MKRLALRLEVACLAAWCLLSAGGAALGAPKDLVGKAAPDFTGAQSFGTPVSVARFRGNVPMVVTFWSIYCTSCLEEMNGLQRLSEKYGAEKVAVVTVNEDGDVGVERVKAFLDRSASYPGGKFAYPILFDGKGDVFRAYGAVRLPTLFFVDRNGTVREAIEGGEPGKGLAVMSAIEKLLGAVTPESLQEVGEEAVFDLEAVVPICGTYREGKWYRPLDLDENRQDVVARTRAEGEEFLRREAVRSALRQMGVTFDAEDRSPTCQARYGQELRSLRRETDALELFVGRLSFPRALAVDAQETVERERELVLYRRIKVSLAALREQMTRDGYSVKTSELRVRFTQATRFEERAFIEALRSRYPYLSSVRPAASDLRAGQEYVLVSHASPEKAAEALRGIGVGTRKLSVELVAGGILEVSMWR